MENKKVKKIVGYSAFDKVSGKALRGYYSNWTTRMTLTNDLEEFDITERKLDIEMRCRWYNDKHKNKVDFEIKKVSRIYTTEIIVEEK